MGWNHRVFKRTSKRLDGTEEQYLTIHEAYYDENENLPYSWTKEPITIGGESLEELRWMLKKMLECLDKPILDYEDE